MAPTFTAAALWLLLSASVAEPPPPAGGEVVDRIVAVVDGDPILLSDVERAIALGLAEPRPGEDGHALRRRVLDGLIDQRLRLHEVVRFGLGPAPADQIEARFAEVRGRFSDEAAFEARLAASGLDDDALRHLLSRQLMVLRYIDERLAPRVFVDLDDVRQYYQGTFSEEMARRGVAVPPLEQVRESIRALLREQRLNEEIDAWTRQLRLEADVVDRFDREEEPLPPLVERLEVPQSEPRAGGAG